MSILATVVTSVTLAGLLVLTALLSASEASVSLLTRARVRRLVSTGKRGSVDLDRITKRAGHLFAVRAIVTGVSYAAAGALLTWTLSVAYADLQLYVVVIAALSAAAAVVFVFGEALPRTIALQNPERVALAFARPAHTLTILLYPLARMLSVLWTWGIALVGKKGPGAPWVGHEEYEDLFAGDGNEAADDEAREAEEALIESVERFSERIVREVMVPRTDMVCLENSATAVQALELIREAGFSRLPVYHENLDDIRGVLYARDLLLALGDGMDPEMHISRLTRSAYFVPETKPVHELLVQMRHTAHMALVADEYGGTAGLVTIEDLLEEIVGEIFDEYDRQVPLFVEMSDGCFRVDARMSVIELNEMFDTQIDREADSVGGLFIEEAGHIPEAGEAVTVDGLRLVVQELEGNRILQLVVESTGVATTPEGHDDGDHTG